MLRHYARRISGCSFYFETRVRMVRCRVLRAKAMLHRRERHGHETCDIRVVSTTRRAKSLFMRPGRTLLSQHSDRCQCRSIVVQSGTTCLLFLFRAWTWASSASCIGRRTGYLSSPRGSLLLSTSQSYRRPHHLIFSRGILNFRALQNLPHT